MGTQRRYGHETELGSSKGEGRAGRRASNAGCGEAGRPQGGSAKALTGARDHASGWALPLGWAWVEVEVRD